MTGENEQPRVPGSADGQAPSDPSGGSVAGPPVRGYIAGSPGFVPPPHKSGKTTLIVVSIISVIAVAAAAALVGTWLLTRDHRPDETAALPSSAFPSSTALDGVPERYRLRGTLSGIASVCSASGVISGQIPKFNAPINYSVPNIDADIQKAKQELTRFAETASPQTIEPLRSTIQEFISNYVAFLDAISLREPEEQLKYKRGVVDGIAGRINQLCDN